ncbi:MAG: VWA domain-containing protein [Candidatus Latescibacterota bacterium]
MKSTGLDRLANTGIKGDGKKPPGLVPNIQRKDRYAMRQDYTHITVILDRTGSMESIRDDTIGGYNTFLKKQKAEPGEATLTLVQFDTQDPYEVIYRFRSIDKVPELNHETYVPRASTPLLDALGRGINDLEKSLSELKEEDRPSKVVVVVVTDGQENSSQEFRKDQIEKMVKEKAQKGSWQFVFLSADLAAIGDAMAVGIHADAVLLFEKNGKGSASAWGSLSERTSDYRSSRKEKIGFEQGDRKHPADPEKKEA